MGTMKTMMMSAGERNAILVYTDEAARWERLTGAQLIAIPMKLEASCSHYEWHPTLGCNVARRLLHDDRLPAADREELRFRLEVGGLPTDLPDWSYSWGDRWSEFVDHLFYGWPAQLAKTPRATGRIAAAANVLRAVGLRGASAAIVGWEYERIDFLPIAADHSGCWARLRAACPWAFNGGGRPAWYTAD
jgi:hypothetical protein